MIRQSSADRIQSLANEKLREKPGFNKKEDGTKDDVNAYLSMLRKKTNAPVSSSSGQKQDRKYSFDLSDISDISDKQPAKTKANKFLKKSKHTKKEEEMNSSIKFKDDPAPAKEIKKGLDKEKSMKNVRVMPNSTSSHALSSAANLIRKHKPAVAANKDKRKVEKIKLPISDSELEISISQSTSADSKRRKEKTAERSPTRPLSSSASSSKPSTPEGVNLYQPSSRANLSYLTDDDNTTSVGKGGAKFLKNKKQPDSAGRVVPQLTDVKNDVNRDEITTPKTPDRIRFSDDIQEAYWRKSRSRIMSDNSDDALDTADLVDGLSSPLPDTPKKPSLKKPTTPPSPKKNVTIHESIDEEFQLDDMMVVRQNYDDDDEDEDEDDKPAMNFVMDFDDLESNYSNRQPEKSKTDRSKSNDFSSSYKEFGVVKLGLSDDDEEEDSDRKPITQNILQIFSDEEVETEEKYHLPPAAAEVSSKKSHQSVSQYTEDFDNSIVEDISEKEESQELDIDQPETEHDSSSDSSEKNSDVVSITRTETLERETVPGKKRVKLTNSIEIQTSERGLFYMWNNQVAGAATVPEGLGMEHVDPSPIAQYVVSPEALEAVTCYNPCTLVLNDMIKQQLAMTRNFIAQQKLMYETMLNTIHSGHRYTTLEETRAYIKKNRPKKMTFKEALKEVEKEMNGV